MFPHPALTKTTHPAAAMDATTRHEGKQSLRVTLKDEKDFVYLHSTPVPVKPGRVYRVSFWARNTGTDVWLRSNLSDAKGKLLPNGYGLLLKPVGAYDWKRFEAKLQAKPGDAQLGLTFFISKTPGSVWLDDVRIERVETERGNEVVFRMTPNWHTDDNVYHLSQGDPMIVFLTARNEAQYQAKKPRVIIELPEEIELLGCDYDAIEFSRPKPIAKGGRKYVQHDYEMGVPGVALHGLDFNRAAFGSVPLMLRTKRKPGPEILDAWIRFVDGKLACRSCLFRLKIVPSVQSARTPKRFRTQISSATSLEFYGKPLEAWVPFYRRCGFNGIRVPRYLRAGSLRPRKHLRSPKPVIAALKKHGLAVTLDDVMLANGYRVRGGKFYRKVPDAVRLKRADGTILKDAFDPAYIRRRGEWFVRSVNDILDTALAFGADHLGPNWEPYMYTREGGSFTDLSLQDFATFTGMPIDKVRAMKPLDIVKNHKEKLMAFQSWQFAETMKVIRELVHAKSKAVGREIEFIPCVSPALLDDLEEGKKYYEMMACMRSTDFLKHLDAVASWAYSGAMDYRLLEDERKRKLFALGYRGAWGGDMRKASHRGCLDRAEAKTAHIRKVRAKDGLKPIPYVHYVQGKQGNTMIVPPESIGLQMLSAFVGGADGCDLYYFPRGYDGRYWQSAAQANDLIAFHEDQRLGAKRVASGFALEPKTDLFKHDDYRDDLVLRVFEKDGRYLLALCNYDPVDEAVVELRCDELKGGRYVLRSPYRKEHYAGEAGPALAPEQLKSAMLTVSAASIDFLAIEPYAQAKDYGRALSLADVRRGALAKVPDLDKAFAARLASIAALKKPVDQVAEVFRTAGIEPIHEGELAGELTGTGEAMLYRLTNETQQLLVDPANGAVVRSWKVADSEQVLDRPKENVLCRDRFYFPADYMTSKEFESPYQFAGHKVAGDGIEASFERTLGTGELKGFTIRKTYAMNTDEPAFDVRYDIRNGQTETRSIGLWTKHMLAVLSKAGGAKPGLRVGGTAVPRLGQKTVLAAIRNRRVAPGFKIVLDRFASYNAEMVQARGSAALLVQGKRRVRVVALPETLYAHYTWSNLKTDFATFENVFLPQRVAPGATWSTRIRFVSEGEPMPVADRPRSVTARCGDVLVRINGQKLWTLGRIEYKGTLLCVDRGGSQYGTVVSYPGVGWIGTGHRENEDEDVRDLRFFVDGNAVGNALRGVPVSARSHGTAHGAAQRPLPTRKRPITKGDTWKLDGKTFRMVRLSRIREFRFENTIEVRDNRIHETVVMQSEKQKSVGLIYQFMHPWTPTMTEFIAGGDGKDEIAKKLGGPKGFPLEHEMDWVAVYDAPTGRGIVSRLLERPKEGGAEMLLWDVNKVYRKFYLRTFVKKNGPVPAGFKGTYRLVTAFLEADAATWQNAARRLAAELAADNDD